MPLNTTDGMTGWPTWWATPNSLARIPARKREPAGEAIVEAD
jgi:hypothetical protein